MLCVCFDSEISVPNAVSEAAERRAQELGMSLSEFHVAALTAYLATYQNGDITRRQSSDMNCVRVAQVRVGALRANLLAGAVGIPVMFLCLWLARVFGYRSDDFPATDVLIAATIFLPVAAIHELLHGAAALVHGRLRLADLHVHIHWKALGLVCHVKVPVRVRTARIVGITPLAVTGPVLLAILAAYPSNVTAVLAGLALIGGVVDLLMLYKLRPFDGDLLFVDHPTEPAFEIYAPS